MTRSELWDMRWAAVWVLLIIAFVVFLLVRSSQEYNDANFYGAGDMRKLATKVQELHQDVYILQTQVAGKR